jgi:hypothetical protein
LPKVRRSLTSRRLRFASGWTSAWVSTRRRPGAPT